jgi:uncharacterized Zn finger protein
MNCPACNQQHVTHSVHDGDKITCQRCGQMFVVFVELVPQYTTRLLVRPGKSTKNHRIPLLKKLWKSFRIVGDYCRYKKR